MRQKNGSEDGLQRRRGAAWQKTPAIKRLPNWQPWPIRSSQWATRKPISWSRRRSGICYPNLSRRWMFLAQRMQLWTCSPSEQWSVDTHITHPLSTFKRSIIFLDKKRCKNNWFISCILFCLSSRKLIFSFIQILFYLINRIFLVKFTKKRQQSGSSTCGMDMQMHAGTKSWEMSHRTRKMLTMTAKVFRIGFQWGFVPTVVILGIFHPIGLYF